MNKIPINLEKTKKPEIIKVDDQSKGMRLDRFLRKLIPGFNQAHLEKLIGSGGIRVNGKKSKANIILENEYLVSLPPGLKEEITNGKNLFSKNVEDLKLIRNSLIIENDEILVLNKPQGIPVQGGSKISRHIDGLLQPAFKTLYRPLLVHRLDKNTSGVLIVAKNRISAKNLTESFKKKKIKKIYLALVKGKVEQDNFQISKPLKKKKYLGKEKVFVDFEDGDEAITNVKVISSLDNFSFLALSPVTGRTHQLRVHLSDIGHPIVGDNKYDETKNKSSNHFRNPTLQLHCFQLIFSLLSGKVETVQAEIRNDMKNNINALGVERYIPELGKKFLI